MKIETKLGGILIVGYAAHNAEERTTKRIIIDPRP